MKTSPPPATVRTLRAENAELRARLAEAEDTLRAIRAGEVDALVVESDVGPQIFTLQGLDAQQNRYRGEMLAQVSDSVIAVDNEEHITFLNATAERQYGVRADEAVGRKLGSVITRYWPSPDTEAEMWTAMSERGEWRGELIHRTHDGRELHIESSVAALRGPDGERVGVVRTIRDVSERKRLELEKAEALRLLDTLLTHAPVGFVFLDLDLRFVRINDRLAEINGLTIAAHLGKTVAEILPTLEATLRELTAHILATGQPVLDHEFSGETARAPGMTRYWNQSWYPVHDERGEIMGCGGLVDEITERKRAEEALRQNERRFRGIFDSAFQFIGLLTPDGTVLEANQTALKAGALRAEDVIGKPFWECDWWTLTEQTCRELRTAIGRAASGELVRYDVDVRGAEGQVITIDFSITPIRDEAGRVVLLIPEGRDITCLKLVEENLRLTNDRFELAVRASTAVLWQQDLELRFTWLHNPASGIDGSNPVGKRDEDFLERAEDAAVIVGMKREVIRSGVGMHKEFSPRIQGVVRCFDLLMEPLRDNAGNITGLTGAAIDITARKLAENDLRESEAKLRNQLSQLALLEQITLAISSHLDFQHILKVVTDSLEDALQVDFCCVCLFDGQAKECAVAQVGLKSVPLARELAIPEHAGISLDCVALAAAARGELSYLQDVREMELPFLQRLAEAGLRSLIVAPLPLEGKVIGFLVVARREERGFRGSECEFLKQLSEHVALAYHQAKLHDSLQTAYDDLRRTQQAAMQRDRLRALGQMASGIAHDISNAISPVTLYAASLLEHESDLSVRARDYLQTIHQSVQNVAQTIARMRDFYRPDEPQVVLTPVHLNLLAQQAWDVTRVHWSDGPHERGIVIQTELRLAEDLPDILGVEGEIRDAIVNLIFNAVDAMPEGGTLTLRTMTKPISPSTGGTTDAPQAYLEVIDTGIGMDADTHRRCLEPFFTTKGDHGTGLGLTMVDGMIARHRARIEIESTPGQGTTVRLLFPVSAVASNGLDPPWEAKPELTNQRILFIDDDPRLLNSMRNTLQTDGHTVVTAAGGQAGIEAFIQAQESKEAFTVVITDLGMPHVDGRKVASAVRAASPSTPVIMLTGWGQQLETEGNIPAQVDWLLSKPPNLHDLREALAACCPPGQSKPTNA